MLANSCGVNSIAIDPQNPNYFVAGGNTGVVRLFDWRKCAIRESREEGGRGGLALGGGGESTSSSTIYSSSIDKKLFGAVERYGCPSRHVQVTSVAFSQTGKEILASYSSSVVYLFRQGKDMMDREQVQRGEEGGGCVKKAKIQSIKLAKKEGKEKGETVNQKGGVEGKEYLGKSKDAPIPGLVDESDLQKIELVNAKEKEASVEEDKERKEGKEEEEEEGPGQEEMMERKEVEQGEAMDECDGAEAADGREHQQPCFSGSMLDTLQALIDSEAVELEIDTEGVEQSGGDQYDEDSEHVGGANESMESGGEGSGNDDEDDIGENEEDVDDESEDSDDEEYYRLLFGMDISSDSEFDEGEEEEEEEGSTHNHHYHRQQDREVLQYTNKYTGHKNVRTIKECSFFGPDDCYVASGSDDGSAYIWNKYTGRQVHTMKGDKNITNVVQGHPLGRPIMVTSGIERYVKVWEPQAGSDDELGELFG